MTTIQYQITDFSNYGFTLQHLGYVFFFLILSNVTYLTHSLLTKKR